MEKLSQAVKGELDVSEPISWASESPAILETDLSMPFRVIRVEL